VHAIRDSSPSLYRPAAIQWVDIVLSFNILNRIVCLSTDRTTCQASRVRSSFFSSFELHDCLMDAPWAGRRQFKGK
jgi:hypothetical protein